MSGAARFGAALFSGSLLGACLLAPLTSAGAAEIALYDTGPSEDAAFVRFVNAGPAPVEVTAAGNKARLALTEARPVSDYLPVRGGSAIKGAMVSSGKSTAIDLNVAPGEFVTVIGVPSGSSSASASASTSRSSSSAASLAPASSAGAIALHVLRDTPDDFNALKAAVAFYSSAPACAKAGVQVAGKTVDLFRDALPGSVTRRLINPVALSVQLICSGKPVGAPLSLGTLAAGQRYSLFAVPAPAAQGGARLFAATDVIAR